MQRTVEIGCRIGKSGEYKDFAIWTALLVGRRIFDLLRNQFSKFGKFSIPVSSDFLCAMVRQFKLLSISLQIR